MTLPPQAVHLMCLTVNGGNPVFTRKKGNVESLPFSTVASLNGTHMFCKSQGIELKTTHTADWIFVWKDYDSVTLICAGKNYTEKHLSQLIVLVYNVFLLFITEDDLKATNNFDRIRRETKNFMPLIEKILNNFDSDFLEYSECILAVENTQILGKLNEFALQFGSLFCAIMIGSKIIVATEGWWDLNEIDRKLLIILFQTTNNQLRDIPVYLPKKSPNTAYRFVAVPIVGLITLCVLCGSEPSYHDISLLTQQIFKNDFEILQNAEKCIPRNISNTIEIEENILGLLVINKIQKKYVMTRNLHQASNSKRPSSGSHRLDILKLFFYQAVDITDEFLNRKPEENKVNATESYWSLDYHKCHAYNDNFGNLIIALYASSIPIQAMRLTTKKTLENLISHNESTCWNN
ncbi:protein fuzzy [Condylostylus longicornis]|uniref:protein fuzzy n=1 Tax=Condylostylus longicornis TaxID=2530218 RepID=UPI00244E58BB|nr:protein fuzzy [Condylostylus longicornis]